ncbi:MAG: hypothetical protein ACI92E_001710 [Oceanicoccus sp.]|jgi:hypothetical protein
MHDNGVVSYILVHDSHSESKNAIQDFCHNNQLIRLREPKADIFEMLRRNINLGAIFLAEDKGNSDGDGVNLGVKIHKLRPEVPIFLRTNTVKNREDLPERAQHCFAGIYHFDRIHQLQDLIKTHIFSDDYPNHIVNAIQTLSTEVIKSQLIDMTVTVDSPSLVNDRFIHGNLHSIIPLESSWCKGHMMIQVEQEDIGQLINSGQTFLGTEDSAGFRDINGWLSEMTNLIWGILKSKLLSQISNDLPISDVQLPVITNHNESYITFGTSKPYLSIRYTFSDNHAKVPDITLYQKFIFSITWTPTLAAEYQIVLNEDDDDCLF